MDTNNVISYRSTIGAWCLFLEFFFSVFIYALSDTFDLINFKLTPYIYSSAFLILHPTFGILQSALSLSLLYFFCTASDYFHLQFQNASWHWMVIWHWLHLWAVVIFFSWVKCIPSSTLVSKWYDSEWENTFVCWNSASKVQSIYKHQL